MPTTRIMMRYFKTILTKVLALGPLVHHILFPLKTYPPCVFSARHFILTTSDPAVPHPFKKSVTIPILEISHKVRELGLKIKAQHSKPNFHVEEQTLKIWKLELGSQVLTIRFTHGQSTNMLSADQLQQHNESHSNTNITH